MSNKSRRRNYNDILKYFPNIELSYEKYTHNKVQSDIYLLIPKGKKCFLWFKMYKNKPHCFLMTLNLRTKKITAEAAIKKTKNKKIFNLTFLLNI